VSAAKDLDVVLLCGGFGTRLREETEFKPKPMVEIGGRPIMWHIMKHFGHFGAKRFVLALGYRGDMIRDYFVNYHLRSRDLEVDLSSGAVSALNNGAADEWQVVLAETGSESLTGARIRRVLKYLRGPRFFATYGDGVSNVNLDKLLAFHKSAGRLATVTAVHPSSRFGELAIADGLVKNFREKPQVADGWINGGFFVFEKAAFDRLRPSDNLPLETAVLETLAAEGQLAVYQHHGFWQCMDTVREMQLLNEMWQDGRAPWHLWAPQRMTA
jgi:glucose-1-phosphate cytidylyltransferase